jgi:hypothetical protein
VTKKKKSPTYKVYCSLRVFDFPETPDVVSQALGVKPTETWRKGDLIDPRWLVRHKEDGWGLDSPHNPSDTEPSKAIEELLRLIPDEKAFQQLPAGCEVQVTCTIYAYRERPFVYLPASLIARLAAISANLDVDIYDLSSLDHDEVELNVESGRVSKAEEPRRGYGNGRRIKHKS